jgi:tetratricopeptide (TPR) repeat protein
LPEPSKALVTSREYRREFRSSWPIELNGMSEDEAQVLIQHRLRLLRIEKIVNDQAQLLPLVHATGGNPKAIEMALGYLKYERRPISVIVDDLYAARGELFDDLFARSWTLLDENVRRVLLAMPLFPNTVNNEALAATADVHGFAFDHAIERLSDLALLDIQQIDLATDARYSLHPLVRAFAEAKLNEAPEYESEARNRWVTWYIKLTNKVGHCWSDPSKLELLDHEQETIFALTKWCLQHKRYHEAIQVAKGVDYYYYVRGLWDKCLETDLIYAEAAHAIADSTEEVIGLAFSVHILTRQGNISGLERNLRRLHDLAKTPNLTPEAIFLYHHAVASYQVLHHDLDAAEREWKQSLSVAEQLPKDLYVTNRCALATILYHKGELAAALELYNEALQDAIRYNYARGIVNIQINLANIYLDQDNFEAAATALTISRAKASEYHTRDHLALTQRTYARMYALRGDIAAAIAALSEAIDLFERLGMRRELSEACAEMENLTGG